MRPLGCIAALLLLITACAVNAPLPDTGLRPLVPLFSFVFDDGYDTDALVARDLFREAHAVASTAITTDRIGAPGYLTAEQIIGLRDEGWEIMAHTASHPNLRSLSPAEVDQELRRSKEALEGLGIPVRNLVYPYNKSNPQVRQIAANYYRSARGGGSESNSANIDRYDLHSFSDRHRDLRKMQKQVDRAYGEKAWIIIYHHDIDAKITMTGKKGTFLAGETLRFSPSRAEGRFIRDLWFLTAGSMHLVPLAGTALPGDSIVGLTSGATARMEGTVYDERQLISSLLAYVRTTYPDMAIVTIDQGLDRLNAPQGH